MESSRQVLKFECNVVNGEFVWEADLKGAGNTKATVHTYKNATYVNVRDYFWADGKLVPTKRGVNLSVKQWKSMCEASMEVEDALAKGQASPNKEEVFCAKGGVVSVAVQRHPPEVIVSKRRQPTSNGGEELATGTDATIHLSLSKWRQLTLDGYEAIEAAIDECEDEVKLLRRSVPATQTMDGAAELLKL